MAIVCGLASTAVIAPRQPLRVNQTVVGREEVAVEEAKVLLERIS